MAIGKSRFFYNNLLSDATFTASSVKTGIVTSELKDGTGSGVMAPTGNFSADEDLEYTIEIDDISGGTEVGQSLFRWKDGGTTWDATNVTTSTVPITLNNGISIKFTSGTGADFVLGDMWFFNGENRFSTSKMIDLDRDTTYRSNNDISINIVMDLSSAKSFDSFIIADHNLSSGATITLEANASDSWGAPTFSEVITWSSGTILHYLSSSQSFRYVRLVIADAGNADGFIKLGELFLTPYLELSRTFQMIHPRTTQYNIDTSRNKYGIARKRFFSKQRLFSGAFNYLTAADIVALETMMDSITDSEAETLAPIFFNLDSEDVSETFMMELDGFTNIMQFKDDTREFRNATINMIEVAKSV